MTSPRDPDIAAVLDAHEALAVALPESSVKPFFERCHAALKTPGTTKPKHQSRVYSVCDHIPEGLRVTASVSPELARLADAFGRLAPRLNWQRRDGLKPKDPLFPEGHANAALIGNDGLEYHDSVRLGVSLIAPMVEYPDHNHPPEEGYLVMSGGDWRQDHGEWFRREPGETVHNVPNIWHAMRAGEAPLLALWMLWMKD
jgi:hypothetical protein